MSKPAARTHQDPGQQAREAIRAAFVIAIFIILVIATFTIGTSETADSNGLVGAMTLFPVQEPSPRARRRAADEYAQLLVIEHAELRLIERLRHILGRRACSTRRSASGTRGAARDLCRI